MEGEILGRPIRNLRNITYRMIWLLELNDAEDAGRQAWARIRRG
jgi:hypothetical protein